MTEHAVVGSDPLVAQHAALITKAVEHLADAQVRHRGTFGGALAHADPAGDLGAPVLALDAEFVIAGPGGTRTVPASRLLRRASSRPRSARTRSSPRSGSRSTPAGARTTRSSCAWPTSGRSSPSRRRSASEGGRIAEARIGLTNMGSTPLRARAAETALAGQAATERGRVRGRRARGRRHQPALRPQRGRGLPAAPGHGADPAGRPGRSGSLRRLGADAPLPRARRGRRDLGPLPGHRRSGRVLPRRPGRPRSTAMSSAAPARSSWGRSRCSTTARASSPSATRPTTGWSWRRRARTSEATVRRRPPRR